MLTVGKVIDAFREREDNDALIRGRNRPSMFGRCELRIVGVAK